MFTIKFTRTFKKLYEALSENTKSQVKVCIKKLSSNPGLKILQTKLNKSLSKELHSDVYESSANLSCKLFWKCDKNNKTITLIDIKEKKSIHDTIKELEA